MCFLNVLPINFLTRKIRKRDSISSEKKLFAWSWYLKAWITPNKARSNLWPSFKALQIANISAWSGEFVLTSWGWQKMTQPDNPTTRLKINEFKKSLAHLSNWVNLTRAEIYWVSSCWKSQYENNPHNSFKNLSKYLRFGSKPNL